jgi:hypothetical protein
MKPQHDSPEAVVERLSPTFRARKAKERRTALINRILTLLAILFVGWHLASFVSLLREIRDKIQDQHFLIDVNIEEKRIDDVTPQTSPTQPTERPSFWRGA